MNILTKLPFYVEKHLQQEIEMITYRLALQYFPQLTYITGNPMTVEEATKHLDNIIKLIIRNL